MKRQEIIDQMSEAVMKDREATYGTPVQSFDCIAQLWDLYMSIKAKIHGDPVSIEPKDVAAMMILLKIARSIKTPTHADNWKDMAGFAVCGGEIATLQKTAGVNVSDFVAQSDQSGKDYFPVGEEEAQEISALCTKLQNSLIYPSFPANIGALIRVGILNPISFNFKQLLTVRELGIQYLGK